MNANYQPPHQWLRALDLTINAYKNIYGDWQIPIGQIIRLQRPSYANNSYYDDKRFSLPIAGMPFHTVAIFTLNTTSPAQSKHNFGQSRNPNSSHYFDQAPLYIDGKFKKA